MFVPLCQEYDCKYMGTQGYCSLTFCAFMKRKPVIKKPQTNADHIRAMSDEELAELLLNRDLDIVEKASKAIGFTYKVDRKQCFVNIINWLKEKRHEN